jgi:hypothetical protein
MSRPGLTVRVATICAATTPLRRAPVSVCLCRVQVLMRASSDQELTRPAFSRRLTLHPYCADR